MARVIDAVLSLRDNFTPTLRKASQVMEQHSRMHQRMGKDIQSTADKVAGYGKAVGMLSVPLMAAASAGLKLGSDFNNGMAKVSTLVDTSVVDMQAMRKEIVELSNATGVSVVDLAAAQYQCMSAGVEAGKSVKFLGDATKTAKAGFTDASTAINALTTVLNAYGKKAEEATGISDQLMVAQNFGKTTINDMAQSIGNVIPIAAALNVSTEELFASIATLTRNGIGTSEAITGLKAAYSNIIKPSGEAQKMAAQLGIEFNGAHLKAVGWAKFLQEVSAATGGNTEQMAQLFGSVEALNNVLVLAGKGSGDFAEALKLMHNSAGATEEAYEKLKTPSEETKIAMNQLYNAGMDLANGLGPLLKSTTMVTKAFAKALNDLTPEQKEMLTQLGKFIIVFALATTGISKGISIVGGMTTKFGTFSEAIKKAGGPLTYLQGKMGGLLTVMRYVGMAGRVMFMTPIGLAIMAVVALAYLLYYAWTRNLGGIKEKFSSVCDFISKYWKTALFVILVALGPIGWSVLLLIKMIRDNWEGLSNFLSALWETVSSVAVSAWDGLTGAIRNAWDGFVNWFNSSVSGIMSAINSIGNSSVFKAISSGVNAVVTVVHDAQRATIGANAGGTDNWRGGLTYVHEKGAEIIDLPRGSRVYPHDKSLQMARSEGAAGAGRSIHIAKLADSIVVREEADIQRIAKELAFELQKTAMNMA